MENVFNVLNNPNSSFDRKLDPEYDFYSILNCVMSANKDQIVAEYRNLLKTKHPDKLSESEKTEEAKKQFLLIQRAFEVLSNEKEREIYDVWLKTQVNMPYDNFKKITQDMKGSFHFKFHSPQLTVEPSKKIEQIDEQNHDLITKFRNYEI